MTTWPTHAPLSALSLDEVANVRHAGRGAEPIFTGTIRKRGVIEALKVRPNGAGKWKYFDGSKRTDALRWLAEHGESANGVPVTDDFPVPIKVYDIDDAAAREISLILNVARAETHPVDRYRRFAELKEDGATDDDIAATYGLKLAEVRQALALGVLHPVLLNAWRSGALKAEAAQAYTLAKDGKLQVKVFERLRKSRVENHVHLIRQELKAEDQRVGHLVEFVGPKAYADAGGRVTHEDLFRHKHVVSDPELLQKLADEKLAKECEWLIGQGWGWAAPAKNLPDSWRYNWQKLQVKAQPTPEEAARAKELQAILEAEDEAEDGGDLSWEERDRIEAEIDKIEDAARARAFGQKQMTKSGVVVEIDDNGALAFTYGVVKPDSAKSGAVVEADDFADQRRKREKAKKDGTAKPGDLSNALVHRLSLQATAAAAAAIKGNGTAALDLTIAALASNASNYEPGVKLRQEGLGSQKARASFVTTYENVSKLDIEGKLTALADLVALAFDFQCNSADTFKNFRKSRGLVIAQALGKPLVDAARKAFDAEDYFGAVAKPFCLAAITEAIGADEARRVAGKSKAEIAKFATVNVPPTGWLPPELRTAAYDGPAVARKAAPKADAPAEAKSPKSKPVKAGKKKAA